LVAVTGSFGKTTTARAIRCALGLPVGANAGPNSSYALALSLMTVPGRAAYSVFEVGIGRTGQMRPTSRAMRPSIAVVTGVGSEHSAAFQTLDRTREEKALLVDAIVAGGSAVLNGDDPHVRQMIGRAPGPVITFGFDDGNDVQAEAVELRWPSGMRIAIRARERRVAVDVQLFGRHQVYSILAAVAVGLAAGIDVVVASRRLATLQPTPGRMQIVTLPSGAHLLRDEYKSGLETIERALDVFAQVPGRRIAVLGEITEPPAPQHPQYVKLGQRVAALVDRAIILGKKTDGYRTGLKRGGLARDQIVDAGRSWRRAFDALDGTLGPGDVVLIKGRHDERLERVALALAGRRVGCELVVCNTPLGRCETCAMLEQGWGNRRPIV
jgi:UDP-N-acetylmuramoyl-tripeptide--D-alanyl-D-alanine ligase